MDTKCDAGFTGMDFPISILIGLRRPDCIDPRRVLCEHQSGNRALYALDPSWRIGLGQRGGQFLGTYRSDPSDPVEPVGFCHRIGRL